MKAYLSTAALMFAMASAAQGQTIQAGIAGSLGSSGVGLEADAAFARSGIFGRAQAGVESRTRGRMSRQ